MLKAEVVFYEETLKTYVMINFIRKQQHNYLLKTGIIFFSVSLLISILILYLGLNTENSRLRNSHSFFNFAVLAVIFGPILEELIFRGVFSKYKILRLLYFVGIPFLVLYVKNYYVLFLFIPHVILLISKMTNKFKYPDYVDYFVNALLFALIHFQFSDLSVFTVFDVFIKFGAGLVFVWIMLNFGIIKSILAHIVNNLAVVLITFFALQFPEQTQYKTEYQGYTMEWKQVPIISETKGMMITFNDSSVSAKRIGIHNLCQVYDYTVLNDSLRIPFQNQMTLYNIEISKNDSVKTKLNGEVFRNLMLKAELLTIEKNNK